MELVLWILGGLLLLGAASRASESHQRAAKPWDEDDDVLDRSPRWRDDDEVPLHYGQEWRQWQATPTPGASYSHGWLSASGGTDTAWESQGSAFCPAVNIDGTPMATCSIDVEGKPYGVTDTWSDDHGIGDHGIGTTNDFSADNFSTHSFDNDWMNASSGIDHSWDDRW